MKIIYTSKFEREYKKLPKLLKDLAEEKEKIFKKNPFDKKLETYKLRGKLRNFWAFSISHNCRVIFEASKDKKTFYFYSVGDHKIYK